MSNYFPQFWLLDVMNANFRGDVPFFFMTKLPVTVTTVCLRRWSRFSEFGCFGLAIAITPSSNRTWPATSFILQLYRLAASSAVSCWYDLLVKKKRKTLLCSKRLVVLESLVAVKCCELPTIGPAAEWVVEKGSPKPLDRTRNQPYVSLLVFMLSGEPLFPCGSPPPSHSSTRSAGLPGRLTDSHCLLMDFFALSLCKWTTFR